MENGELPGLVTRLNASVAWPTRTSAMSERSIVVGSEKEQRKIVTSLK